MFGKQDSLTPKFILNPTLQEHANWLPSIAREYNFIEHLQPVKLQDFDARTELEVVFTHPLFEFEKPNRLSKKTGKWKPAADFFAVFNPEALGSGVYGAVYPVIGVWKYTNSQWIFKTKSSAEKLRLVKTDILKPSRKRANTNSAEELSKIYQEEQQIGKWVDHMGFKYPMVCYNTHPFILMRKQEGATLDTLLQKLKVNPNAISIYEKLMITINLLKAIDTQVSGVKTPQSENDKESYLVHRDIKPNNIIIDGNLNVRFIDFGLAHPSTCATGPRGTPIYNDPRIHMGCTADKTCDLYSLFRVIGEIWGDVSSDPLITMHDLRMRNFFGSLSNLLYGISGLTGYEKANLCDTIEKMVNYSIEKRLEREKAIERFEDLLEKRVALDKALLTELIGKRKPKHLTADELIIVLKSPRALEFLKQFKKEPSTANFIGKTLGERLLELDDLILAEIGEHTLTIESLIKSKNVTIEQITKLIKMGVRVKPETLSYWLTSINASNDELRWARMCRLLYNATENGDKVLDEMKEEASFKYLFCHQFLRNKHPSLDDQLNVRLLKQHLLMLQKHKPKIDLIKRVLKQYFPKSPFVSNLLIALEPYQSFSCLVLAQEPQISLIEKNLLAFQIWVNSTKFEIINGMANRSGLIKALETQLNSIPQLNDWEVALEKIERCTKDMRHLHDLESSLQSIRELATLLGMTQVIFEADEYYDASQNQSIKLIEQTSELCNAFNLIYAINQLRKSDSFKTLVDYEFNRIILIPSLKNAQAFNKTIDSYYQFYRSCDYLFQFIKKQTRFTYECRNQVESSIKQLQTLVMDIVCAKDVPEVMQQIRKEAQTMMTLGKPSQYDSLHVFYSPPKGGNSPAHLNSSQSISNNIFF